MGYALFTARKLMLQNRLNQMNYRLMVLSQKQQDLTQQSANLEMQNSLRSSLSSVFSSSIASKAYDDLSKAAAGDIITVNGKPYSVTNTDNISIISSAINAQLNEINAANAAGEASSKLNLQSINAMGNQIDMEMKKLTTQLQETSAELKTVEEAEEKAIQSSAPKYSGGNG